MLIFAISAISTKSSIPNISAFTAIREVGSASLQFHPELLSVDLSHNKIVNIQYKTFEAQVKLQELNLAHNDTRQILFCHSNLTVLDISFNNIKVLSDQTFMYCNKLVSLNIANNALKNFSDATFSGLLVMKTLKLSYNNLETIPVKALEKVPSSALSSLGSLEVLHLSFNNHV